MLPSAPTFWLTGLSGAGKSTLAALLARHGVTVIVAAISHYRSSRDDARGLLQPFFEIHVHCPLDTLIARDPKGLYHRALRGELAHFTGISAPYEAPLSPELTLDTSLQSPCGLPRPACLSPAARE